MSYINTILTVILFISGYAVSWLVVYWVGSLTRDINDQLSRTTLQDGFQFLCWVIGFIFLMFIIYFTWRFNLYWRLL